MVSIEDSKDRSSIKNQAKTETITFRLPTHLIEELRNDAELEEVSLNAFVTRIFSNHIQWERYERKVGLLPMTKPFLKEGTESNDRGTSHKSSSQNREG